MVSRCLNANLLNNSNIKNEEAYTLAVSSLSGLVELDSDALVAKGKFGSAGISDRGRQVKSITLNEFDVKDCSFIKIYVEGREWKIIKGHIRFFCNIIRLSIWKQKTN